MDSFLFQKKKGESDVSRYLPEYHDDDQNLIEMKIDSKINEYIVLNTSVFIYCIKLFHFIVLNTSVFIY